MKPHRLLTIGLLFALASALRADDLPLITSPGTGPLFTGSSDTVGDLFQVGANPLTIISLGLFDSGTPGLSQSHSVGLWKTTGINATTGTLLAEVDFSPGVSGFSLDGFLYQNLVNPVVLQPGALYILGASYPSGTTDFRYANDAGQYETWSPSVTFLVGRYTAPGVGFTFPNATVSGLSYVGANALYAVPEPNALIVILYCAVPFTLWRLAVS